MVRALIQKEIHKENDKDSIPSQHALREDLISRDKHFGKVENRNIDTYMIYGCPTFSRHEKIERSLIRLDRLIARKDKADAMGIFNAVKDELTIALAEYENEKFQADLIERLYNQVKRFIDFMISEGSEDVAFDAFEFYKSLILKLNLGDGRAQLLKKLNTDTYYLKLKELGTTFESTDNGERGSENVTCQSKPDQTEKISLHSCLQPLRLLPANNASCLDLSTVLLEYYCGESQQGVFVCKPNDSPVFIPLRGLDVCRDTVERLSDCLSSVRSAVGKSTMIGTLLLSAYNVLIAPLSEILQGCDHLIISPTDFLFKCPFSALYDGEKFLIEKFTVSLIPSHSLYDACLKNSVHSVGTINFVHGDSTLKGISEELGCLSKYFSSDRLNVLTHLAQVKKRANDADVLHMAAHGAFDSKEPLLSRIHLGTSDALTVIDLYEMDLSKVRLAVVNACVTGKAQIAAADDLFGLVRGFFVAGCPSVINTLWNLNDEVAPIFTDRFYRAVTGGQGVLDGFTTAVRTIARSTSYQNPYYWACYQYYGKP